MKRYYFVFREGSKINQIICAILINLPVFAYGASIGWMSPMTLLLQSERSPRGTPLTDAEVSWMAASAYLTCIPCDIFMNYLCGKLGRKTSLMMVSAVGACCWVLKLSSMETWAFIGARMLVGVTMAGAGVACPLYTKEISEDSVRGVLGSLIILAQTSGNLFLYVIGDVMSYQGVLWVCLSLPVAHLVLFLMMPESPSYLVKNGKLKEATKALAWLRCRTENDVVVIEELEAIKKEQKIDDESGHFAIKAIMRDPFLRRAFTIALVLSFSREVCGAIPVLNFAGQIFDKAATGLVLTPNQQAMMLGAVQLAGSALASSTIEKTGRKPLLFISSLISGISMCALASWFLAKNYNIFAPGWIPVVTLCICIFCDACGFQPLSIVITAELFSYTYRGTAMAIAMCSTSSIDFFQMLFFKPLVNAVGVYVAFYFFGIMCLLSALYVALVVPETKQRTTEEIYKDLRTKKEKQLDIDNEKVQA